MFIILLINNSQTMKQFLLLFLFSLVSIFSMAANDHPPTSNDPLQLTLASPQQIQMNIYFVFEETKNMQNGILPLLPIYKFAQIHPNVIYKYRRKIDINNGHRRLKKMNDYNFYI